MKKNSDIDREYYYECKKKWIWIGSITMDVKKSDINARSIQKNKYATLFNVCYYMRQIGLPLDKII